MAYESGSEEHGGIDPSELQRMGIAVEDLIDFSVNSNPFGPPPVVRRAILQVDLSGYPDRHCAALRSQLADANRVQPQEVLVGNGTAELIWLAAHALLRPGDTVLIVGPTFGEYRRAAEQCGAQVIEVAAQPPDFSPPLQQVIELVRNRRPRLVFLCDPNNPTGQRLTPSGLDALLEACREPTCLLLDHAYRAFVDGVFFNPPPPGNCLVLRSMTKDFALAGLRLGYALGDPALLEQLEAYRPAWSVNAAAQAAGLAVLDDLAYYRRTLAALQGLCNDFFNRLGAGGFEPLQTCVHFTLLPTRLPAIEVRGRLLRQAIQVRDCASFGLPQHIRISTQLPEQNRRLLAALPDALR